MVEDTLVGELAPALEELRRTYGEFSLVALLPLDDGEGSPVGNRFSLVLALGDPWLSPDASRGPIFMDAARALNEKGGGLANVRIDRISLLPPGDPFLQEVARRYGDARLPAPFRENELEGRLVMGGVLLSLLSRTPPGVAAALSTSSEEFPISLSLADARSLDFVRPYEFAEISEQKRAEFSKSFQENREKCKTIETVFEIADRARRLPGARPGARVVARTLLNKAPFVAEAAAWSPYGTWDLATAFERHLIATVLAGVGDAKRQRITPPTSWREFDELLEEIRGRLNAERLLVFLSADVDFDLRVAARVHSTADSPWAEAGSRPWVAGATAADVFIRMPAPTASEPLPWAVVMDPGRAGQVTRYTADGGSDYAFELEPLSDERLSELASSPEFWAGRESWPRELRVSRLRGMVELEISEWVEFERGEPAATVALYLSEA